MTSTFDSQTLAALPVFQGLAPEEIAELQSISTLVTHPAGTTIFVENQPGDALYAVLKGSVNIRIADSKGVDRTIATLAAGAVLGEMALVTRDLRSASAVTAEETSLLRRPSDAFAKLVNDDRMAAYRVICNLAQVAANRLREVNQRLIALTPQEEAAPQARKTDELAELKRKLFTEWKF